MHTQINLSDLFEAKGTELEEFIQVTKGMDDCTEYIKVPKNMIEILSCEAPLPEGNGYRTARLNSETVTAFEEGDPETGNHVIKKHVKLAAPGPSPELDESMRELGFVILDSKHNRVCAVSSFAIRSLANRILVAPPVLAGRSLAKDLFIAKQLNERSGNDLLLCCRNGDGAAKIFAFFSNKYKPQPLSVLGEIAEDLINTETLGNPVINSWLVNHDIAQINIEFPEAAEDFKETYKLEEASIPGVLLQSSGIGSCSLSAFSTFRHGKAQYPVILESIKRRHTADVETEDLRNEIAETVLNRVTKMPERLADLMAVPIGVPPVSDRDAQKNRKEVFKVYKYVIRKTSIQKIVGKEKLLKLLAIIQEMINPYKHYTAYDIAETFLHLTDNEMFADYSPAHRMQLQQACGSVPFVSFKEENILEEEDEFGGE